MKKNAKYLNLKIVTTYPREVVIAKPRNDLTDSSNADNQLAINEDIEEENALFCLASARDLFLQLIDSNDKIIFTTKTIKTVNEQLDDIQINLLKALDGLPTRSVEAQAELTKLLRQLAIGREEIGNALLQAGKENKAINFYKKALEIYTAHYFARRNPLEAFRVYSHLISVYFKKKLYSDVILLARKALKLHTHCADEEESSPIAFQVCSNLILAYLNKKSYSKAIAFGHMALELYKDPKAASMYEKIKGYLIQVISAQACDLISNPSPSNTLQTTALQQLGTFATPAPDRETQASSEACLTLT